MIMMIDDANNDCDDHHADDDADDGDDYHANDDDDQDNEADSLSFF